MSDRDSGGGFFGAIEALLAIIGALTVMGVVAVAASVLAWEMELRKSEQNGSPAESTTPAHLLDRDVRVILKREVRGLGRPGEVKDVADGYAQNFLLPRGLAIEATAGELKHLAQERQADKAKKDRAHADAEELAARMAKITLVFKLKAGEQGKTFGSVTNKDVAESLKKEHRIEIDRAKIVLPEPVKSLGAHTVEVRLLPDVRATLTIAVEPA